MSYQSESQRITSTLRNRDSSPSELVLPQWTEQKLYQEKDKQQLKGIPQYSPIQQYQMSGMLANSSQQSPYSSRQVFKENNSYYNPESQHQSREKSPIYSGINTSSSNNANNSNSQIKKITPAYQDLNGSIQNKNSSTSPYGRLNNIVKGQIQYNPNSNKTSGISPGADKKYNPQGSKVATTSGKNQNSENPMSHSPAPILQNQYDKNQNYQSYGIGSSQQSYNNNNNNNSSNIGKSSGNQLNKNTISSGNSMNKQLAPNTSKMNQQPSINSNYINQYNNQNQQNNNNLFYNSNNNNNNINNYNAFSSSNSTNYNQYGSQTNSNSSSSNMNVFSQNKNNIPQQGFKSPINNYRSNTPDSILNSNSSVNNYINNFNIPSNNSTNSLNNINLSNHNHQNQAGINHLTNMKNSNIYTSGYQLNSHVYPTPNLQNDSTPNDYPKQMSPKKDINLDLSQSSANKSQNKQPNLDSSQIKYGQSTAANQQIQSSPNKQQQFQINNAISQETPMKAQLNNYIPSTYLHQPSLNQTNLNKSNRTSNESDTKKPAKLSTDMTRQSDTSPLSKTISSQISQKQTLSSGKSSSGGQWGYGNDMKKQPNSNLGPSGISSSKKSSLSGGQIAGTQQAINNKSASSSRNISPQIISNNLNSTHAPRSAKNNSANSQAYIHSNSNSNNAGHTSSQNSWPSVPSVPSQVTTPQLFTKKLQEQRKIAHNPNSSIGQKQQVIPIEQPPVQRVLNYSPSPVSKDNKMQLYNDTGNFGQKDNIQIGQDTNNYGNQYSINNNYKTSNENMVQKVSLNIHPSLNSSNSSSKQTEISSTAKFQDINPYQKPIEAPPQRIETTPDGRNDGPRQQNWQLWWNEKKKTNLDFIMASKLDNYATCVNLLDKKKGENRADVNFKDEEQNTALHYAAQNGNSTLVNFLLYNEAVMDSQNKHLCTPLILACKEGHEDVCQILITAGADINQVDDNEDTSLHYASREGHKRILEILLRKPSLQINKKNTLGLEAYQLSSNEEIVKSFQNFFNLQRTLMQNTEKVQIQEAQVQNIQQMFQQLSNLPPSSLPPQIEVEKKQNGICAAQVVEKDQKEANNNEKQNQSDETKGSLNTQEEEKVGPCNFIVHGLIGKGSFGEVYLVEKKGSSMLYAMKVLHKSKIARHNLTKYAMTERNVMSLTNHPFVVRLNFAFQTSDKLFLIMDYCPGGDLGEHLQKEKKFSEEVVKIYLSETILALEDLHKRDVIFRDLKPDNIVLDYEGHVKLTDFGLSKEGVLEHSTGAKSFCGSVAYLAPEMLKRCGHGKAVDWYLLGVVMYELLVGIPPYYANNREELFQNIEKAPLKIPSYLSVNARSLLKALLQRNPAKRLGSGKGDAEEIKAHPFFSDIDWTSVLQRKLQPPRPNRKIRISTKFDPNLFHEAEYEGDKDYIAGWSFVAP